MNSTPTSIRVFGWYLILVAAGGLIVIPGTMLDLFGLSYGPELWLARIIGLLALILGVTDLLIAKHEIQVLYIWTVRLRYFATAFLIGLWVFKQVEIGILNFAAADALGATWTWWTLRNQKVRA